MASAPLSRSASEGFSKDRRRFISRKRTVAPYLFLRTSGAASICRRGRNTNRAISLVSGFGFVGTSRAGQNRAREVERDIIGEPRDKRARNAADDHRWPGIRTAEEIDLDWTIWWDMHRRDDPAQWSRAAEKTEAEALERVRRFLKLGFVVYQIRDDKGAVFMDEAQITQRFGKGS